MKKICHHHHEWEGDISLPGQDQHNWLENIIGFIRLSKWLANLVEFGQVQACSGNYLCIQPCEDLQR